MDGGPGGILIDEPRVPRRMRILAAIGLALWWPQEESSGLAVCVGGALLYLAFSVRWRADFILMHWEFSSRSRSVFPTSIERAALDLGRNQAVYLAINQTWHLVWVAAGEDERNEVTDRLAAFLSGKIVSGKNIRKRADA